MYTHVVIPEKGTISVGDIIDISYPRATYLKQTVIKILHCRLSPDCECQLNKKMEVYGKHGTANWLGYHELCLSDRIMKINNYSNQAIINKITEV